MALSFADDIRPLFRDSPDIESMKDYGLDLSSYKDVRAQQLRFLSCSLSVPRWRILPTTGRP
jgi:hypothetical protein